MCVPRTRRVEYDKHTGAGGVEQRPGYKNAYQDHCKM